MVKSTDRVIGQILKNSEFPIKRHALLKRIGGIGWTRFEDILDYMLDENAVGIVKVGAEEHILKRDSRMFGGGLPDES